MRLLDTETGLFFEVSDPVDVPYAILSHTWDGPNHEQTYQQVCAIQASYQSPSTLRIILSYLGYVTVFMYPPSDLQPIDLPISHLLLYMLPRGRAHLPSIKSTAPLAHLCAHFALLVFACTQLVTTLAHHWAHSCVLTDPRLSRKIRDACACARADGHKYLWIDSCCIDKSSSAELSEAINAMYSWYEIAVICYAYLSDVPASSRGHSFKRSFHYSRWHTRGWTLQELLAPDVVIFLAADWTYLGTKASLAMHLEYRLDIPPLVLIKMVSVQDLCVAEVMSWAGGRETTREEDQAYCLMGLFGVHMPTLYGEGTRAFVRLQEAIRERRPGDASVFAWNYRPEIPGRLMDLEDYTRNPNVTEVSWRYRDRTGRRERRKVDFRSHFALHPANFVVGRGMSGLSPEEYADYLGSPQLVDSGWSLPSLHGAPSPVPYIPLKDLLPLGDEADTSTRPLSSLYLVPLPCTWRERSAKEPGSLVAIVCSDFRRSTELPTASNEPPMHPTHRGPAIVLEPIALHHKNWTKHGLLSSRLVLLTREDLARCRSSIHPDGVFLCDPHRKASHRFTRLLPPRDATRLPTGDAAQAVSVQLAGWTRALLQARGYTITPLEETVEAVPVGGDKDREMRLFGYKLVNEGAMPTLLVQHSLPHTVNLFQVAVKVRVGKLDETVTPVAAGAAAEDADGATSSPRVSWYKWETVVEGTGRAMDVNNLEFDRRERRIVFRTMLRRQGRNVYTLGIEFSVLTQERTSSGVVINIDAESEVSWAPSVEAE